ncbi:MAG TPA: serine hydrolase domain-containing protein, partial [Mycobacteriales bacterium]
MDPRTQRLLLARLATAQVEARAPSVTAGLVRDGRLMWSAGRGSIDGTAGGPEPGDDVQYRIGSITKTFAAVAVLRLRDEGAVELGEPIEAYLPGCGLGAATVAQVLAHTSGLRSETGGSWWERSAGGDYADLEAHTLDAPGARVGEAGRNFHYSNSGYGLLGELAARLRGRPWAEVVAAEILEPLGMTRTTERPESPAAQGFAVHPWADLLLAEPETDNGALAPAGQLWSTVRDLARWTAFLAGDTGGVLAPETLREMGVPQSLGDVRVGAWTTSYGLGLQLWNQNGRRSHGHTGSMPGFLALTKVTDGGDGVVICANTTSGLDIGALGDQLLAILEAEEPRIADAWHPTPATAEMLALLGIWYWGPTPVAVRADVDGALQIESVGRGGRTSRFTPCGHETWRGLDGYYVGETLRVHRRPDG